MSWPWLGVVDTTSLRAVTCCGGQHLSVVTPATTSVCTLLFGMQLPLDVAIRPKFLPLSFVCYETLLLIFQLPK